MAAHNLDPNEPTAQEKVADCVVRSVQCGLRLPPLISGHRSAAAPSYFPAYQRCLDGATFAQNPAYATQMHVHAYTIHHMHTTALPHVRCRALAVVRAITVLMVPSERIRVLSVGTGRWKTELSKSSRTKEQLNWGLLDWLRYRHTHTHHSRPRHHLSCIGTTCLPSCSTGRCSFRATLLSASGADTLSRV